MPGLAGEAIRTRSAVELYDRALLQESAGRAPLCQVIADDGTQRRLPLRRWLGAPGPEETKLLALAAAPVLDIGCGAGRHLTWLRSSGVAALGVDVAPGAVTLARARGLDVLQGSIFDDLPISDGWGSVLLLDGNIGIGGDPAALLGRARGLLRSGGTALIELEPPEHGSRSVQIMIERDCDRSDWIPWAWTSVDDIETISGEAGLSLRRCWESGGRWFAQLASECRRGSPIMAPTDGRLRLPGFFAPPAHTGAAGRSPSPGPVRRVGVPGADRRSNAPGRHR